jgi:predicted aspartyl protease
MKVEIEIESRIRLVKIPVSVNGQGPFSFTFDTGASTTTLSKRLADRLGIRSNQLERADARGLGGDIPTEFAKATIEVGSLKFDEDEVYVIDLDTLLPDAGYRDGVIGHSTLKHCIITLSYPQQFLRIEKNQHASRSLQQEADWSKFEYIGGSHLIGVPVHINGRGPFQFVLDTGAGNTVITPKLAESVDINAEPVPGIARGLGGDMQLKLAFLESIVVDSITISSPQVVVVDLSKVSPKGNLIENGILGFDFLRNLETHIDYPRKQYSFVEC